MIMFWTNFDKDLLKKIRKNRRRNKKSYIKIDKGNGMTTSSAMSLISETKYELSYFAKLGLENDKSKDDFVDYFLMLSLVYVERHHQ